MPLLAKNTSAEDAQKVNQLLEEANSLLADEKYRQAIDSYRKLLDSSLPGNSMSQIRYGLGVSLYKSGKTDEAIDALMQIPQESEEWLTAQLLLGRSYLRKAIWSKEDVVVTVWTLQSDIAVVFVELVHSLAFDAVRFVFPVDLPKIGSVQGLVDQGQCDGVSVTLVPTSSRWLFRSTTHRHARIPHHFVQRTCR